MKRSTALGSLAVQGGGILALIGASILASCASGTQHASGTESSSGGSGGGNSGGGSSGDGFGDGGGSSGAIGGCNPCTDFSSGPVIDANTPSNAASMFGSPTSGAQSGGPCLLEPEVGALFPNNWLRPRFVLGAPSGQTLFEIRIHSSIETNDLLVYTTATTWTMPKDMWTALAAHVQDSPITVTVRGMSSSGGTPSLGSTGTITIAPAGAGGSMVYWAASGTDMSAMNTTLQGFHVGDETTVTALQTTQVAMKVRATWGASLNTQNTQVQCVGCHTATPDGDYAAFNAQWPWPSAIADVRAMTVGQSPTWLGAGALSNLSPNSNQSPAYNCCGNPNVSQFMLGIQTFSKAHYTTGDRIVVTSEGSAFHTIPPTGNTDNSCQTSPGCPTGVVANLAWFDLESTTAGTGTGQIPRMGDTTANGVTCPGGGECSAGAPNWSHDGNNIVYVSTDYGVEDGRMGHGNADLKIVPYNSKAGGAVTPVGGASDPGFNEYYPAFSPDDQLIAFNRVTAGGNMYIEPTAEVFVVTPNATMATRLAANDPVACSGKKSPGVSNSWPKWCPTSTTVNGKTYYWLIFASKRTGTTAQLYVTGVVTEGSTVTTFPAIYLWNQDPTINNEVPAWDNFQIPPANVQ